MHIQKGHLQVAQKLKIISQGIRKKCFNLAGFDRLLEA